MFVVFMSTLPRASTPLDERRRYLAMQKFSSGSDHHQSYFENEEGGCARADSEGTNNEGKDTRKLLTEIKH